MSALVRVAEAHQNTRVVELVKTRFHTCNHTQLRHVNVDVANDSVILRGTVPTFYLKQIAQTLVKSVDGVDRIINSIEVQRASI